MTDSEFDLLVMIAWAAMTERVNPAGKLQSSLAVDVLALLRGDEARGAAAGAWMALVQQEAKRLRERKSGASSGGS